MNSYPIRSPGYHQAPTAEGVFVAVSRNETSASFGGSRRSSGIVSSIAYGFVPSALATWMTLRDEVSSASRKTYLPAGSVTPGSVIGRLNVKNVRLSDG